ncbi:hypothetical protein DENIS_2650 [Desulfonema ishimotonii]|uniref:CzcB-like barrel-sandwich hybrid domain-containing protein n=1 Tax=Desulfonema ishimotonii TaxID=45657 RepID=A0A401FXH5_9BACT|nr:efflux RND transporter periplasmic adaptor subunit [Desulfonema ishimotonii]GBC61688.1 hypothetical protein DENIS_2650 [Desulfonema ishimotonii]
MKHKWFGIWLISLLMPGVIASAALAEQFPAVVEAEVRAVIAAERDGALSRLDADTGDRVRKGALLGVVFHKDLILRKEAQTATRDYLAIQAENLTKLNARGLATDEELAKAKMDLAVNDKEIRMVENNIDRSKIRAPFSGVIVARHIQPHEWVQSGQPVVEMYDPRQLRIVADIPADMAVKLETGQESVFYFSEISQEVRGTLKVFAPQVDVRSNTIKVYWRVDGAALKKARLLPGMKGVLKLGAD